MIFTTEDLISSIKLRALVPVSQQTFQQSDLIDLSNEEMLIGLVPDILAAKENYFLRAQTVPLVSGQTEYAFPERALGEAIKTIFFKDSGGSRRKMMERSIVDLDMTEVSHGDPSAYYVQGDKIVTDTTPAASGSLEIWYYCRPSDLVLSTQCAKATLITEVGSTLVVELDGDLSALISNGELVDFISSKAPNRLRDIDVVVSSIGTSQITFDLTDARDAAGVTQLEVGDWICPAQTTPIPLIPPELHPILAQMVAARIVEALGDMTKINMVNAKLAEMKTNALKLITNRVESGAAPIKKRNGILSHTSGG